MLDDAARLKVGVFAPAAGRPPLSTTLLHAGHALLMVVGSAEGRSTVVNVYRRRRRPAAKLSTSSYSRNRPTVVLTPAEMLGLTCRVTRESESCSHRRSGCINFLLYLWYDFVLVLENVTGLYCKLFIMPISLIVSV